MQRIQLIKGSCADQEVDVVVNAANRCLAEGGGICGAIFRKAGSSELTAACGKHKTPLKDGEAVITPAFGIRNAKAIIHAVGPNFAATPTAFKELFEAYYNSLKVMMENGYHTIAFPLISSGIFGGFLDNPVEESTKQCCRAYKKFTEDYPEYEVTVNLCAFTEAEYGIASQNSFFDEPINKQFIEDGIKEKAIQWCTKYIPFFQKINDDEPTWNSLSCFSVYGAFKGDNQLISDIWKCSDEAYDSDIIVHNYWEIIEETGINESDISKTTEEWVDSLNSEQILACIAWHFRRDHFNNGSLINDSVAKGHLLALAKGFVKKYAEEKR